MVHSTMTMIVISLSKAKLKEMHLKDDPIHFRRFDYNHNYVPRVPTIVSVACYKFLVNWNNLRVTKARTREMKSLIIGSYISVSCKETKYDFVSSG